MPSKEECGGADPDVPRLELLMPRRKPPLTCLEPTNFHPFSYAKCISKKHTLKVRDHLKNSPLEFFTIKPYENKNLYRKKASMCGIFTYICHGYYGIYYLVYSYSAFPTAPLVGTKIQGMDFWNVDLTWISCDLYLPRLLSRQHGIRRDDYGLVLKLDPVYPIIFGEDANIYLYC